MTVNILAFDTCFDACSAAAVRGLGGPAQRAHALVQPMQRGHAEQLVAMISEVMSACDLTFGELHRIGVTVGPGSFSGTRIGVAAARAFSLANATPVVAVTSLAVMAVQAASSPETSADSAPWRPIMVAVDVRRGEVYVQVFDHSGLKALTAPQITTIYEASEIAGSHAARVVGSGAEAVVAAGNGCSCIADLPQLQPDARYSVTLVSSCALNHGPVLPLYLRAPDAKPPTVSQLQRL